MKRSNILNKKALLLLGVLLLGLSAWPALRQHRKALALRTAKKFASRGDYRNASLSARRALLLDPHNVEACRILAGIDEISNPSEALDYYQHIVTLQPNVENKLELAAKGLRYQGPPYALATQTLEDLAGAAAGRVSYCVLNAELALKLGRSTDAEGWFQRAAQLQPTNELHQLNLAMLKLNSTNPATAKAAQLTLEGFRTHTRFSELALRALIAKSIARQDAKAAEKLSNELLNKPGVRLEDQLQHWEILQMAGGPELMVFPGLLRQSAVTNAARISAVTTWMLTHGLTQEALGWLTNTPPAVREEPSVRIATVECLFALKDGPGAERFLKDQTWGELEPMRLGFLSQAAVLQRNALAGDLQWRLAVNQAHKKLGSLMWLAAKATEWDRQADKETALWEITQQFPNQRWALRELADLAQAEGRTRDLHRLYARMALWEPKDPLAENNFAATGLLLQVDLDSSHKTAAELVTQYPHEPTIVSTYAYSLHLQNRTSEGLAALESLSGESLTNPPIALYYGVLLRAEGATDRAGKYFQLAQSAPLLPEERKLLDDPNSHLSGVSAERRR